MDWKQLLASITGSVDEELRLRNAYLAAENRILRHQITGTTGAADRCASARPWPRLARSWAKQALEEIATIAKPDTILAWHRTLVAQKSDNSQPRTVSRTSPHRPGAGGLGGADGPRESLVGL